MYAVNFEICALLLSLLCLLYSLICKRKQYIPPKGFKAKLLNRHFVFLLLVSSNILAAVASVGGAFLQVRASHATLLWQYLLHALYFIFHSTLSVCFTLYIMNINGTSLGRRPSFFLFFTTPYLCSEFLILTNPLTGLVFYMDETFVYHRGPLMPLLYLSGAVYIILGFVFFFRYKRAISQADSYTIGFSILLSAFGILLQALFPHLLVELFAESLTFLFLMMLLEDRSGDIDQVTGALNRAAFADTNRRLMETGQAYDLILVHLSNLEACSKLFSGREVDQLLIQVNEWLSSITAQESVYRYRHETFALILYGRTGREVYGLARKILARFDQDWRAIDLPVQLEAVVSMLRIPQDVDSLPQLEELLAATHRTARSGSQFVTRDELTTLRRNLAVEKALRRSLDEGTLQVWYQPIWSAEEGRTVAAEALLRVNDDSLGPLFPDEFIPVAEKTDMIRELGLFVFEQVCRFLEHGPEALHYIELNLSIYQFLHSGLIRDFEAVRARYHVPAERLNLEITESASDSDAPASAETMEALGRLGYTFSLDDYGTGYSNLIRLISSDYKNVKIDKAILWDAEKNPTTARLLDNLIQVVRSLGMNVIQEGVETKEQLDRVLASGCNLIQGFYFSRPIPQEQFITYLKQETKKAPDA